ncbi:MAG: hypothetical protein H7296_00170 [Bacteroidia bacterium]|nr:hypothetical protein [Bacteroidia bacterium]
MKKKILFLIAVFEFIATSIVYAQFQTGISGSNNSGVLGVTINPANTNKLSNGTDIMPLFFSSSVLNNDFYLPAKPITSVIKPEIFSAFTQNEKLGGETINQKFERLFNLKRDLKTNGYIFADLSIYGPSFLTNIGPHSFGIITAFKGSLGTVGLPPDMATFLQKGLTSTDLIGKTFQLNKVKAGAIAYTDIAFNYSYKIKETFKTHQRLGVTFHYLTGINSIIFEDYGTTWTVFADTSLYFSNSSFQYNYSANKAKTIGDVLTSKGNGFSFDIGYSYAKKSKIRATRTTYCPNIKGGGRVREFQTFKWKFGISVMDIGFINFNKQTVSNSYVQSFGVAKHLDADFYRGVFALNRAFIYGLEGSSGIEGSNHIFVDNYTHFMPTRVNVQYDYHYKENWYFSFYASQRTPLSSKIPMRSPNILSLSARYETLKYEVGLPISLIEYQYPVLGLNFRIGPFMIGTNQLLEMVGLRQIKGLDFYFGFKFNISNIRGV